MYSDQLAVGDYDVGTVSGAIIGMTITDTKGHTVLNRENITGKGKFAVTSDSLDYYELCFTHVVPPESASYRPGPIEVYVDYRVGVDAKEYSPEEHDSLAEIETNMRHLEDLTNSIIIEFAYLKRREKEMRSTNESTNTRLFYQTTVSIIVFVVLAGWQVLYLRTYFRTKKLID